MAHGQVGELGGIDADFEGVSARGVQEPVTHHCPEGMGRDHRLGDEAIDGAKNNRSVDSGAGRDFQRRIERKMSDEYGQPAKHHALRFGKQLKTPIQRRLQGLLTRRRAARSHPQQRQSLVEKRGGLM